MPYTDIAKRRECHKRYYERHKELYIAKNIRRKKLLAQFVNNLKNKPCMDCGIKYPPYVMDFDHRDRNKKLASINYLVNISNSSEENILKEIEKCDLVCANCHRIRTYCGII